jgi:cytochrome P450
MSTQAMSADAGKRPEIGIDYYNPSDRAFIRDPWPVWNRLVREHEICYHRDLQMWFVNSHELCAELLRHPKFSQNHMYWSKATKMDLGEPNDFEKLMGKSLTMLPPAEHLRIRKLTLPAFSRKVMDKIEMRIRDVIVDAFDAIGTPETFDAYSQLAEFLPSLAIARMVGIPPDQEDLFHNGLATNLTIVTRINKPLEQRIEAKKKCQAGFDLLRKMVADRRALPDPGDDFIGTLIKTDEGGDKLDDEEIVSLVTALITAGSDTAIDLYTYAFKELLENPDQLALLAEKPELMESALHEILRHGSQGVFGLYRFAMEDVELGGQQIKKGDACVVNLSVAKNDPRKYDEPRRFDITRPLDGNLVFGSGAHFCIGTFLVRAQAKIAITELIKRFPNASLTGEIDYDYNNALSRRINKLIVKTNL